MEFKTLGGEPLPEEYNDLYEEIGREFQEKLDKQKLILQALGTMHILLTRHNHVWTTEESTLYEGAVSVLKDNIRQLEELMWK